MRIRLFDSIIHRFGKNWFAPIIVNVIEPFLPRKGLVLDVGAGGGWIGDLVREETESKVTLLDIIDLNRTKLPLVLYDGKKIPFPDKHFDASLLLFVLHHCSDSFRVLKEATRVSKSRVIIIEESFRNPFEKFLTMVNDIISNIPFFLSHPLKMPMTFNYKTTKEWEDIFDQLSLKVYHRNITKHFLTRHVLYVLDVIEK